jgi:hypothetical protein
MTITERFVKKKKKTNNFNNLPLVHFNDIIVSIPLTIVLLKTPIINNLVHFNDIISTINDCFKKRTGERTHWLHATFNFLDSRPAWRHSDNGVG